MDYLQNHCWCSSSCWTGEHYDCRHMVSITSYQDDKDDWKGIVDDKADSFVDQRRMKAMLKLGYKPNKFDTMEQLAPNLRPHVLQWLEDNVKDRVDLECNKGWCVGNAEYRGTDTGQITVFFHRKRDAMAFVKKFSKYKKPVNYCQYFTDVRKKLNLDTLKYEEM